MSKELWLSLKQSIVDKDADGVLQLLTSFSSIERVRAIYHLEPDLIKELFVLIPSSDAADILEDFSSEQAADLVELLDSEDASRIMDQLSSSEKAHILIDVDEKKTEEILDELHSKDAEETRRILEYPEDSAAGLMNTEFLAYAEDVTVDDVLSDLQKNSSTYSDYEIQYIYLVSVNQKLKGVLRLRDLMFSLSDKKVGELAVIDPIYVHANISLDDLSPIFDERNFVALPVVDQDGCMLGVVRRRDVVLALGERNKNTYLKSSGIVGGEELRSMPLWRRSGRRLSWLSVNIILNVLAASVIAFYQDTLAAVIALAVFLPIISDMSGCSGNQAVAVSIRELTMGLVRPFELVQVLFKEMRVGIINGLILGVFLGVVAYLWKGNFYLGVVVGGALAANTIVAVCIGGMVPLLLKRMGKDPALASGPILTTVTDMCGFFLALTFATVLLPYLT